MESNHFFLIPNLEFNLVFYFKPLELSCQSVTWEVHWTIFFSIFFFYANKFIKWRFKFTLIVWVNHFWQISNEYLWSPPNDPIDFFLHEHSNYYKMRSMIRSIIELFLFWWLLFVKLLNEAIEHILNLLILRFLNNPIYYFIRIFQTIYHDKFIGSISHSIETFEILIFEAS